MGRGVRRVDRKEYKERAKQNSNQKIKEDNNRACYMLIVSSLHACPGHKPLLSNTLRQDISQHMKRKDDSSRVSVTLN